MLGARFAPRGTRVNCKKIIIGKDEPGLAREEVANTL